MTFAADATIRISLVLLAALAAAALLRRRSAALRHWVLATGIACAVLTPAMQLTLPSWHIVAPSFAAQRSGLPPAAQPASSTARTDVAMTFTTAAVSAVSPGSGSASASRRWPALLVAAWMAGVFLAISALAIGLWRLSRARSMARLVTTGVWSDVVRQVASEYGVRRRITVLESDDPSLLMTWGFVRPTLMVPAGALHWPETRVRVVVRHELAHVSRGDWPAQLSAELLRAVYWFNPLLWILCRRLRQESEHACDDAVLNGGVDAAEYASHLVDLARAFRAMRRAPGPALAMARPSSLEGRISAMLNARVNRGPLTAASRIAVAALLAALTLPIALAAQNQFAKVSGTIVDQTNRFVPNAKLALIATKAANSAKYEITADATGRFEFVGVPAGEYKLVVDRLGFKTYSDVIAVAGVDIARAITLQVGQLQETITSRAGAAIAPDPDRDARVAAGRAKALAMKQATDAKCAAGPPAGQEGGDIKPPVKLVDVKPVYPEALKATHTGGVVTLEALIDTDGAVREIKTVSASDPDLERAASDAVRQWQFSTTYLNCTPIEVRMNVLIKFVGE